MVHGETKALEDTAYLFICDGPVLFFGENEFSGYLEGQLHLTRTRPKRHERRGTLIPCDAFKI